MSATLAAHIDRLSQLANSIRSTAPTTSESSDDNSYIPPPIGPFSRAMLKTPLGDLIRDIDPAEIGLFTIVQPTQPGSRHSGEAPSGPLKGEITRAEFTGATPLKRPPTVRPGRDDPQRPREHDPEVYVQAALKYLDRYQSIRPMPRAMEQAERIVEQLAITRGNIQVLSEQLKQTYDADPNHPPLSPKSMAKEEERQIQEIQAEIAELRKRKETLTKRKAQTGIRANKLTPKPNLKLKPPSTPGPADPEHSFWNTPAASARTLRFTDDLLTDEQFDSADLSVASLPSPLSAIRPPPLRRTEHQAGPVRHLSFEPSQPRNPPLPERGSLSFALQAPRLPPEATTQEAEVEEEDEEDQTVVIKRPPGNPSPQVSTPPPETRADTPPTAGGSEEPRKSRFKITTEFENIIMKIWATVGDIIMPGHPFDVSGTGGTRPPRAKETLSHLRSLSEQAATPSSPTGSSLSSLATAPPPSGQVTPQQILIAHLLLALLSNPPSYSVSLNQLKESLASQGSVRGQAITRPIYGCIAKKLLKIDRGGGEQVVRFDV